jgi:hypothetical protein
VIPLQRELPRPISHSGPYLRGKMDRPFDIAEIERMSRCAAFLILEIGPDYGFVLDRLETIPAKLRKTDPTARTLRVLQELKCVSQDVPQITALPSNTPI